MKEADEHASFNRNLKKGLLGDDVSALQRLLNSAGDSLNVDGNFGSKTYAAVKEFQKSKGLKVDGIAGKDTITALGGKWAGSNTWSVSRLLKKGCKGDDVKAMQKALVALGYSCGGTGADGNFGANTLAAVKSFQKAKGLKVDGIAGKDTVTALGGKRVN